MHWIQNIYYFRNPSGRLLQIREPYAVNLSHIIKAASERGCYMELDSQPQRLNLNDA